MIRVIAVIPARGGSKGVPNKNKKNIAGKPLISYTIESALKSKLLAGIIVSSDDLEILEIAKQYKNVRIHQRKKSMSSDISPVGDTVNEIIKDELIDAVMLLQPSAPIRTGNNIDEVILQLHNDKNINSVISVVTMHDIHPARMYWNKNNYLIPIMQEYEKNRRQDIPPAYYRNGSIYITRISSFIENKSFVTKPVAPYIMPYNWLLNIDEPRDILIAEILIPAWLNNSI